MPARTLTSYAIRVHHRTKLAIVVPRIMSTRALRALSATTASPLVWLGPCIGPKAFEVGAEVREAFLTVDHDAGRCFEALPAEGKYLADLPALLGC